MHLQGAGSEPSRARRGRRRWCRVRVQTDDGAYVGRLRLDGPRASLRETVDDDRAYLALWNTTEEATGARDDFVAIHKGAIRFVVLLGEDGAPPVHAEA